MRTVFHPAFGHARQVTGPDRWKAAGWRLTAPAAPNLTKTTTAADAAAEPSAAPDKD